MSWLTASNRRQRAYAHSKTTSAMILLNVTKRQTLWKYFSITTRSYAVTTTSQTCFPRSCKKLVVTNCATWATMPRSKLTVQGKRTWSVQNVRQIRSPFRVVSFLTLAPPNWDLMTHRVKISPSSRQRAVLLNSTKNREKNHCKNQTIASHGFSRAAASLPSTHTQFSWIALPNKTKSKPNSS